MIGGSQPHLTTTRATTPRELERTRKAASVQMLYAALEGLAPADACNAILAAVQDARFTEDHLTDLGNRIGRAAHMKGRIENWLKDKT